METADQLSLPEVIEVKREDENWQRWDFDEEAGLVVKRSGEERFDFYVNMDNVYLKAEQKRSSKQANLIGAQFKFGLTLIGLTLLNEYAQDGEGEGRSTRWTSQERSRGWSPIPWSR